MKLRITPEELGTFFLILLWLSGISAATFTLVIGKVLAAAWIIALTAGIAIRFKRGRTRPRRASN